MHRHSCARSFALFALAERAISFDAGAARRVSAAPSPYDAARYCVQNPKVAVVSLPVPAPPSGALRLTSADFDAFLEPTTAASRAGSTNAAPHPSAPATAA